MEKKVLGGAVIGYGGMGGFHANQMLKEEIPGIELVGVYDIDPARLQVAREKGIEAFESREALLSDERIDLVVIATPNDVHKEIAIDAMAHGKHVVSEKPVTLCPADLEEMLAAANRYGKLFTVHQNRRFDGDFLLAKHIMESGDLGEVFRIESRVQGSRGIPSGWREEKEHGGGMLYDWGVHMLDQMLWTMGEHKLVSVYATMTYITNSECDDGFSVLCKFDNGVEWIIEISTNNFISLPRWYVLGVNGSLVIDDWDLNGKVVKVTDFSKQDSAPVAAGMGITRTMAPRTEETIQTVPLQKEGFEGDWNGYYRNLIAALNGEEDILVTHDQQRLLVRVIEAIFKSAEINEVVYLDK